MTPFFFTTGIPRYMLKKYPKARTCTNNGFKMELTL